MLSTRTLNDEAAVATWLEVFEVSGSDTAHGQLAAVETQETGAPRCAASPCPAASSRSPTT